MGKLRDLGFVTKRDALAFINKRHRGLTGVALGDSVKQSHFPPINKTAAALRCIAEDGMPIALIARYFNLDRRNLVRALPRYRKILEEEVAAIAKVEVSDAK
jgi:DNA invertase Pin-like site-specific DNA recombinase